MLTWAILFCPPLYSESPSSVLQLCLDGEISELIDPQEYPIISQKIIQQAIYSTLFRFKDDLETVPCLAKSFTVRNRSILIELQENIRFSDGRPITARDVISSIKRLLKAPKSRASLHRYIDGAESFVSGDTPHCPGLEQIDSKRVRIRFRNNNINLIQFLSDTTASILPEGWQPEEKVYSGPYTIEQRRRKDGVETISLRANPYWTINKPGNEQIVVQVHKFPDSMTREIQKGHPDYFLFTFGNEISLGDIPYHVINMPTNGQFYVLLNPMTPPLDKIEWRFFLMEIILEAGKKIHQHWSGSINSRLVMPYGLP